MSGEEHVAPPPKKKNKTIRQQCAEDMAEFEQRMTATFTSKLDRLEQAMIAMAAPHRAAPADDRAPSMAQPPNHDANQEHNQPLPTGSGPSQSVSDSRPFNVHPISANESSVTAARAAMPQVQDLTSRHRNEATALTATALTSNVNNDNDVSPAWIISQAFQPNHAPANGPNNLSSAFPISAGECNYDEEMEAKVNHILASTAHHLAAAPGKNSLFPHRFVSRGPDRRKPAFNTLTLSEHVWGIFMIMRENKVPASIKPLLYKHIQNIIEDSCSFDWATAVRPWSEEVFSQVDEGRLQWDDNASIQMPRMSMSGSATAKIDNAKVQSGPETKTNTNYDRSYNNNSRPRQNQQASSSDIMKGGPPCEYYNSPQGCSLQSGHIIKGQRMIHVCRYCLYHTSAAHQHSETYCRNKTRLAPQHF